MPLNQWKCWWAQLVMGAQYTHFPLILQAATAQKNENSMTIDQLATHTLALQAFCSGFVRPRVTLSRLFCAQLAGAAARPARLSAACQVGHPHAPPPPDGKTVTSAPRPTVSASPPSQLVHSTRENCHHNQVYETEIRG